MPASTLDPVNAALRTALSKSTNEQTLDTQLAGATKKALLSNIEFEQAGSYQNQVLNKLKTKYIVLKTTETPQPSKPTEDMGADETLKLAKYELYPLEAVQLGWKNCDWSTGAGMVNMGNTCYLNSTLQALFHVPALANWLMSDTEHTIECQDSGGCIICAMRKTLQDSQRSNTSSIRPLLIYNKLRLFWRNMIPGRQEDAHEFLRYLVEGMEKAYLSRFKNHTEFDSKIKETTPLNQILGGYLRSAVRCLRCAHVSTTFQHFQDLLLDIRKATTLDEALELYFSREKLDDESYQCESCHKKVPATKQFSLARTPMVLCIQLKRFSVSNNKITKHIMFRQRLDLTKYACQRPNVPLIYRLVALVTHMGPTVGCGHYTAVAQAPSGIFYQFDDSTVRQISHQAVFSTNAYIMLYELESTPYAQKTTTVAPSPAPTCSKVYGPELPPERNGHAPTKNGNGTAHTQNSDSDSESESDDKAPPVVDTNKKPPTPTAAPSPPTTSSPVSTSVSSLSSPDTPPVKSSTKLVPYESDDTNSSDDSSQSAQEVESRVSTKAAVGEWQVTSTTDAAREPSGEAGWETTSVKKKTNGTTVVNELFKMSHGGYAAPVQAWNGTRSQLDKEVSSERREERKRALQVDETEQGRVKHPKISSICKSNPGYNPIQEFHNSKNWSSNGSGNYNKQFFSGGNNRHRRNFHHKNYNKNYRYRQ